MIKDGVVQKQSAVGATADGFIGVAGQGNHAQADHRSGSFAGIGEVSCQPFQRGKRLSRGPVQQDLQFPV